MKTSGKIIKLLPDNLAEVSCEPASGCTKCRGCAIASSGEIILQAKNQIGAGVGDGVEVEIAESEGIKAALIVFIFPVIGLLFGYFIGTKFFNNEQAGIIGGFLFIGLVFLFLNLYDKYLKSRKECKAVVTRWIT